MSGDLVDLESEVKRLIEEAKENKAPILDLSRKGLSAIPREIFELIHLERLDLYNNNIHVVPADISKLKNLKKLYLSDNRLTTLPVEIGELSKLEYISVIENPLLTLPKEIAQLRNLKGIYVDDDEVLRAISHFKDWVINAIPVPGEIKNAIKQYLIFFTEYVRVTKGSEIKFEIRTIPNGLEIHTRPDDEEEYDRIIEYLREYLELIRVNIDEIKTPNTQKHSNNELIMFMVDLKNQLRFLHMSLERKEIERLMMEREMERVYGLLERKFDKPVQLTSVSNQSFQNKMISDGSSEVLSIVFQEILFLLRAPHVGYAGATENNLGR